MQSLINRLKGLTGNPDGIEIIISNADILRALIKLTTDPSYVIAKDATFCKNQS